MLNKNLNVLIIGDIVGKPGRKVLAELLPEIKREYNIEITIANGENAAGGFGLTPEIVEELFLLNIDVITSGNHLWDKKEVENIIPLERRLLRPANYPEENPGSGSIIINLSNNRKVGVICLSGRVFIGNLDCPFKVAEKEIAKIIKETNIVIVDFHAEATSEKQAIAWFLDGKVSAVIGTHTHVQTCDEKILPRGTAYITDIGMTGAFDSVLGVKKELVIQRFLTQRPKRYEVAKNDLRVCGVVLQINEKEGKAINIKRIEELEVKKDPEKI